MTTPQPSLAQGRLCILGAAILWSLSGAFTKVLTKPTIFELNLPVIEPWLIADHEVPVQIAFYRAFFAGLVLVPTLRRADIRVRPTMFAMLGCFALMNASFITAVALGNAANAIFLQNSAPLWMYLASVYWLGEKPERRGTIALAVGLVGIGIIVAGEGIGGSLLVVVIGLVSGVTYAGVILGLRILRDLSPAWLTVWNHVLGSLVLLPFVIALQPPSWQQFITLFLFGAIQLGLPYWLMARGLRTVSASEAGAITLLEPILTPVWAYLVVRSEAPSVWTFVGGAVIIGALAYRYWPRSQASPQATKEPAGSAPGSGRLD